MFEVKMQAPVDQQDSVGWAIVRRSSGSLVCCALGAGLGWGEPILWFTIWSAGSSEMYGNFLPGVAIVLVAWGGLIAGGLVGLIAGGFASNRVGLTITLAGLATLQFLGSLVFFFPIYSENERLRIGQLALLWPSLPVNVALAASLWIIPAIAVRRGQHFHSKWQRLIALREL